MMEKVFQNILDNAFKFTPSGGCIKIFLKKNDGKIIAEISGTGLGIDKEEITYIFDRYYQIKRISSENSQGTELGLAIVKKILDIHGFSVQVKSVRNNGTTFILTFPVFQPVPV